MLKNFLIIYNKNNGPQINITFRFQVMYLRQKLLHLFQNVNISNLLRITSNEVNPKIIPAPCRHMSLFKRAHEVPSRMKRTMAHIRIRSSLEPGPLS